MRWSISRQKRRVNEEWVRKIGKNVKEIMMFRRREINSIRKIRRKCVNALKIGV